MNLVFHVEFTLPLSRPMKLVGMPKHVIQRDFSGSSELRVVIADFAVNNGATTSVQSTNNLT